MNIYSWNINGIRAISKKGFVEWIKDEKPDVLCVQESRAYPGQVAPSILEPDGYKSVWYPAKKKGYSGVAVFYKNEFEPLNVIPLGVEEIDIEGRVQIIEYKTFHIINAYFPNSQDKRNRLTYKLDFFHAVMKKCRELRDKGINYILCGDYNVAHKEIDLARPENNVNNPGFYPEERAIMQNFLDDGSIDVFRHFHPNEPDHYTWWSYRTRARERNVGWRLDYHCVNKEFLKCVKDTRILSDVMGSDHCPVFISIEP
jgi:exodeoxyribonuclease III